MRRVLVDVSAFITLAEIGHVGLLRGIDGQIEIPAVVQGEIVDGPAAGALERGTSQDPRWIRTCSDPDQKDVAFASEQLGMEAVGERTHGDVALLAHAIGVDDPVVVTDDNPLRKTCKALGIPLSGSIGVVIAAVERGDLDPEAAKAALVAMDEVGARLSARLLRRAERLIDAAAGRN